MSLAGEDADSKSLVDENVDTAEREMRIRSLTEKGASLFYASCKQQSEKLDRMSKNLEGLTTLNIQSLESIEACEGLKNKILDDYGKSGAN